MKDTKKTFKKIILDDLKANKLDSIVNKIKSIKHEKYSGGNSLRIIAVDLTKSERESFETLLADYEQGHFDGMNDIYEYKKEKSTKERTAKYVFLNVEYSSELYDKAKNLLANEYLVTDDLSSQHRLNVWYDVAVRRLLTNDFKWN